VTAGERLQRAAYAASGAADPAPALAPVSETAASLVERIRLECGALEVTPADLPVRSRQAFQWLAFVAEPERLATMARTLRDTAGLFAAGRPASIALVPGPMLYQARRRGRAIDLRLHIGFWGAPATTLASLVGAIGGDAACRAEAKRYGRSDAYAAVVATLEDLVGPPCRAAVGRHYDLEALFHRLNHRYFQGRLEMPRLRWSRRRTVRKMGHYDVQRDTVVLSATLDAPGVPPLVVEYVLYHELLHKVFGVSYERGRCRAHTPAFRRAEARFSGYETAKRMLNGLT
jgi:hypothetical protein